MLDIGHVVMYLDPMTYFMTLALAMWGFSLVVRHLPWEDSGDDGDEPEL